MKKILVIIMATVTIACCAIHIHNTNTLHNDWEDQRTTITITVAPNKTLWSIAEEYKPDWMDTREYIYDVKTLNNMDTSFLDVGQTLEVYTMPILKEVMNSEKNSVHN